MQVRWKYAVGFLIKIETARKTDYFEMMLAN
jgi:hypothetical protein